MSNEKTFEIEIPADKDGFVLLQCEYCGTLFKVSASDFHDDSLLHIYCPCCGLVSENYLTEDALNLAKIMVKNYVQGMIYDRFKKLEHRTKNSFIRIEVGRKPDLEPENPIYDESNDLTIASFECCERHAKVKPLLKMTGCYCPFCGVKDYEVK